MKNMTFRKSLTAAAVAASLGFPTLAVAQDAQTDEAEVEVEERIQVTGSRIKRVDLEGASPVEVISAEDFEEQGRVSVADVLRNVTANSFGSFIPSSGSSAQSQATVDLLGVGSSRTLVLLDGKRMAGSPSLGGASINLSSIPMAAIERIEILKDGASAIYGSDAIAGVINIILKDDYEGFAFDVQFGRPEAEGADTKQMSITAGISSDRGNITFVYDHQERGAIFDKDRPYTAASMEDLNGDGLISIYQETVGVSYYGATIVNPNTGLLEASPACGDLTANVDGFVGELDAGPAFGYGVGEASVCGYAYANVSANNASTNRDSVMTNASYQVTDDIEIFARGMFSRNDSFGRYAPPAAPYNSIAPNSEHNPYSTPTDGYFRWYNIGPRDGLVTDYQQDYMIGARGFFGETAEWELSYHKAMLDYRQVGRYYLSYGGLAYNEQQGIDPFSDAGTQNVKATIYTEDQNNFDHYSGGVGFSLGALAGGLVQHYIGGEYFKQNFDSEYDAQSEAGLIGGSAGNSAEGYRNTKALFYEVALPVMDTLNITAAYRYDDYSDFGSNTTPSVKAEYRPTDDLLFRASWSEGFRAPSLAELYGATSYSATFAIDLVACEAQGIPAAECQSRQFDNYIQSNENLEPEESTYINAGVVYSGIDDLSVKLDYFNLEVDNVIAGITVQSLISAELAGVLDELKAQYPQISLERDANGGISGAVDTITANGAYLSRKGFDFDIDYVWKTDFGQFIFGNQTTFLTEVGGDVYFGGPSQDYAGAPGTPEWRNKFTLNYAVGDLTVNWTTDSIADTAEDSYLSAGTGGPESFRNVFENHVGTYTTHNVNVNYQTDFGRFSVGARNLFDKGVQYDDSGFWVSDPLYNAGHIGREFYAGYSVEF